MDLQINFDASQAIKEIDGLENTINYLKFFYDSVMSDERYDIDLNEDFGINSLFEEKFGKAVPSKEELE